MQEHELRVTIGSNHSASFQALHGHVIESASNKHREIHPFLQQVFTEVLLSAMQSNGH